jgi:LacI family transcriptional regulator
MIMAKRATISDIAKKVGISTTTVSFVLNKRNDKGISEETKESVLKAAEELGYRPKVKSSMVDWIRAVFLVRDITEFNFHTTFFSEVYKYLYKICNEHKIELTVREFPYVETSDFFLYYKALVESGFDVFLGNDPQVIDFFSRMKHSTVLVEGGVTLENSICVQCDDYSAGCKAAQYAYDMGHRIAGSIVPDTLCPRIDGFEKTFTRLGGECPKEFAWSCEWNLEKIEEIIIEKSAGVELPSLFYCFADNIMLPAIRGFKQNNLKVPDDISLIGTDNLYWGRFTVPALTTVDLNEELFAEKLIGAIKHAYSKEPCYNISVPVRLIERESVKRIG